MEGGGSGLLRGLLGDNGVGVGYWGGGWIYHISGALG